MTGATDGRSAVAAGIIPASALDLAERAQPALRRVLERAQRRGSDPFGVLLLARLAAHERRRLRAVGLLVERGRGAVVVACSDPRRWRHAVAHLRNGWGLRLSQDPAEGRCWALVLHPAGVFPADVPKAAA